MVSSSRGAPPKPISPEQAVLLACALADQRQAVVVLGQTLPAVRDWDALRKAAFHHGVAGLLYKRTVESASTAIPAEQLEALRALTTANERRSLRMSVQLLGLLELLYREGIEAFPVKGPIMAEALYGDVGLR